MGLAGFSFLYSTGLNLLVTSLWSTTWIIVCHFYLHEKGVKELVRRSIEVGDNLHVIVFSLCFFSFDFSEIEM